MFIIYSCRPVTPLSHLSALMNIPKGSIINFSSIQKPRKSSLEINLNNENVECDSENAAISLKELNLSILERSVVCHRSPRNFFIFKSLSSNEKKKGQTPQSFSTHLNVI